MNRWIASRLSRSSLLLPLFVSTLFLPFHAYPQGTSPPAQLDKRYCVTYGDPSAPIHVVEYFSLMCPNCLRLFQKDFASIKRSYIDSASKNTSVYWIFHPHPIDLPTVQLLACFETMETKLGKDANLLKQRLFEAVMLEGSGETSAVVTAMLSKGMEVLLGGNAPLFLKDRHAIKQMDAFHRAFEYMNDASRVPDVPTISINGVVYSELPTETFVTKKIEEALPSHNQEDSQ